MTAEHTIATAVVQSQKKWARKPADFYPTPWDVTAAIARWLDLPMGTRVWEPACGDGDMSDVLELHGLQVESSDLRHTGYGRGGVDFLYGNEAVKADWIISNPPFSLAKEFILRSLELSPNVAMLLSTNYWHAAQRKKLFRETKPYEVLSLTWRPAFLEAERGSSPIMNCIWVVWREGWTGRCSYDLLDRPSGSYYTNYNPDVQVKLREIGFKV